jgi:hypothetical protein
MTSENPTLPVSQGSAISGHSWVRLFRAARFLVIAVGCMPLALGLWNIAAIASFNLTATQAEATVTSVSSSYGGLRQYFPCRYDRERRSVAIEHYAQQRGSYMSVGQKVKILYQPAHPERARVDIPPPYFGA